MALDESKDEMIDVLVRIPRTMVQRSLSAPSPSRLGVAKALLASRRRRPFIFDGLEFAEPVWEIILEVYIASAEGRSFKVVKLCNASGGSVTSALRIIGELQSKDYLARVSDARDARSSVIIMLPSLEQAVNQWIDELIAAIG